MTFGGWRAVEVLAAAARADYRGYDPCWGIESRAVRMPGAIGCDPSATFRVRLRELPPA